MTLRPNLEHYTVMTTQHIVNLIVSTLKLFCNNNINDNNINSNSNSNSNNNNINNNNINKLL